MTLPDDRELEALLRQIDGRPYPAYRDIRGAWGLPTIDLCVDAVQGDPFAAPSRLRVRVDSGVAKAWVDDPVARVAAEDWLLRRFVDNLSGVVRGSGRSGTLSALRPGPEVIERTAVRLLRERPGVVEVRFWAGLPARGRRILGRQAAAMLLEDVPAAAARLEAVGEDEDLARHVESVLVQSELRSQLRTRGLVAFVADGSVLPRWSGVDPRPLPGAVPFESPPSLRVTLDTRAGPVSGMGIAAGVTLVTGGGFHGKSTLLAALQWGHQDHVPGDGRERVVADADTVKIRAEDGRRVEKVDVSNFLGTLPGGRSTHPLSTDDASGSTSQAAALVEAVEAGARVLLMDEDTCATNLMVRDDRMRRLIGDGREPITPLVERIRDLYERWGVSTILVVGGVGDYLAVADRILLMDEWRPSDATHRAHALAGAMPTARGTLRAPLPRIPGTAGLRPTGRGRVRARDGRRVEYGQSEIDLGAVEQLSTGEGARSAGLALALIAEGIADGYRTVSACLDALEGLLRADGLDVLSPFETPVGDIVAVRRHEVAACLNRLRTLHITVVDDGGPAEE